MLFQIIWIAIAINCRLLVQDLTVIMCIRFAILSVCERIIAQGIQITRPVPDGCSHRHTYMVVHLGVATLYVSFWRLRGLVGLLQRTPCVVPPRSDFLYFFFSSIARTHSFGFPVLWRSLCVPLKSP